jgi:hypothetical protein
MHRCRERDRNLARFCPQFVTGSDHYRHKSQVEGMNWFSRIHRCRKDSSSSATRRQRWLIAHLSERSEAPMTWIASLIHGRAVEPFRSKHWRRHPDAPSPTSGRSIPRIMVGIDSPHRGDGGAG